MIRIQTLCDAGSIEVENLEDTYFSGYPFSPYEMVYDAASRRSPDGSKARFDDSSTMAKHIGRIVKDVFWQASERSKGLQKENPMLTMTKQPA